MKRIRTIIYLLLILIASWSCEDNAIEPDAIKMTIEEVAETPGYLWISDVLNSYVGDTILKPQIKQMLDTNRDYFLIYTRAACSCISEKKEFAYIVKIFRDLNFPESKYEIFAMTARSNNHPYMDKFKLNELPAIIYLRNGVPYYSLLDTLEYNIDNLKKYPLKIEELMFEALKKP